MIQGSLITLRPPLDDDLPTLLEMRNDLSLQEQLLSLPRPNTPARVRQWLDRRLDDEKTIFLIIADNQSRKTAGFIQIVDINFTHRTGKLGIALHPSLQGRGLGKEAITLTETHASNLYQLRKIELQVLASNIPAVSLYQKLNYRIVGTLEQHFYSRNQFHDVLIMEKLLYKNSASSNPSITKAA